MVANHYVTFRPAPCHPAKRYYARDKCQPCYWKHRRLTDPIYNAQVAAARVRNKDKIRANQRAWRANNAERERARIRAWYRADPARDQAKRLKRNYGLTIAEYDQMVAIREGKCDICDQEPRRPLEVDHDHATGLLRGLLCHKCNTGIGLLGDTSESVSRALRYLGRP